MNAISLHRSYKQVAKVPACMSANWSQFSMNLGNGYDRTPEITVGSLEGSVS